MPVENILNFVQLTPRVATSGQPKADEFHAIAAAGYRAVINLALPTSDNAVAGEAEIVTKLGLGYFQIPVRWEAPTEDDLRTFIGVMRCLQDRPVWVHCAMNLRVSAFMYHYLRREEGLSEVASRSPVLDRWAPKMDAVWQRFLGFDGSS